MREMTLGQKVKEARITKQMTQKELAGDFITRNMLSQIENDSATPSIKTIEFIASVLNKPISYFIDNEQKDHGNFVEDLLKVYETNNYLECIQKIEKSIIEQSKHHNNDLIRSIYINCCMKSGLAYKEAGDYTNAKIIYAKILEYESDMIFESDVLLYNVYSQLAEVNAHLKIVDESRSYDLKAKEIVNRMIASRLIQSIYISFVEGNYDDVIKRMSVLDIEELDPYNMGRYFMMIGSAHYYKGDYNSAIPYLEKAIPFYNDKPYNSVLTTIYEELSKCYSNIEEYKKAYEFLELTKKK